jgi:hypothetical protein
MHINLKLWSLKRESVFWQERNTMLEHIPFSPHLVLCNSFILPKIKKSPWKNLWITRSHTEKVIVIDRNCGMRHWKWRHLLWRKPQHSLLYRISPACQTSQSCVAQILCNLMQKQTIWNPKQVDMCISEVSVSCMIWVVAQCNRAKALMIEAVRSSETLAQSQNTTRRNNPEDHLHWHCRENFISYLSPLLQLTCKEQEFYILN